MPPESAKLKIDGVEYEVPRMDDWTLGETETVEDILGMEIENASTSSAKMIRALVWVAMHRKDETVKPSDLGEIKLGQIEVDELKKAVEEAPVVLPPEPGGALESLSGSEHSTSDGTALEETPVEPGPRLSSASIT